MDSSMLTLAHASLLLLAPLGFLAVLAASRSSAQALGRARRAASLAVRCLIVLILTLALGGPVFTRNAELPRCTVFLLDVSESLPPDAAAIALRELKPRWDREAATGQRCALVAFAGRPQVIVPPSSRPLEIQDFRPPETIGRAATNFTRALESARSLFQERAANRIVLLTDGLDSTRPARDIALPPGTVGIRLGDPERLDVAIADVQAPLAVRSGEPFDVRVTVCTNRACEIGLSAVIDETSLPDASRRFTAPGAGRHVVVLPHLQQKAALAVGVRRLMVMAEAAGDGEPRNNVGLTAITVTGKPKVLVVQGSPAEGEFVARVLKTQDIEFARQSPAELTPRADALDEYVAVVLAGVPREALPAPTVAALRAYVEHTGGGLWVLGSAALQGSGGYAGGDFEKLLPVAFSDAVVPVASKPPKKDPPPPTPPPPSPPDLDQGTPARVLAPSVALLLVVDKSGSMAGRNIEIVKEACIATAEALSPRDVVAVLAFDWNPKLLLEFTEAERIDYIRQRILRLLADGGTRIQPALVDALRLFELDPRARRCAVKHAVLLSDGDAPAADYETIVRRMAEEGITVSTVCVSGAKFDAVLMSQIASWGKGRFKFTNSFSNVPKLILNETQQVIAAIPKDDQSRPPASPPKNPAPSPAVPPSPDPKPEEPPALQPVLMKDAHEIFAGIEGRDLPGLRGRLAAAARPGVEVPLTSPSGQPVLALGRLGLGKTAVWTSDLSGNWSADWLRWKDSPKLFAQLVRYVSGSGPDSDLAGRVRISRDGSRSLLRLDPAGSGGALTVTDVTRKEASPLPVEQNAQGESVVAVSMESPGEVRLLLQRADGKKLQVGLIRAFEEEFAPADPSRDLFSNGLPAVSWDNLDARLRESHVAGERPQDLAPWLIIAALLLLPVDVALRRVMVR
jgi:Ca-activated chloride channel family protein